MTEETLVRVRFVVDMFYKHSEAVVATEYVASGCSIAIPKVPEDLVHRFGRTIDKIQITVFRQVD